MFWVGTLGVRRSVMQFFPGNLRPSMIKASFPKRKLWLCCISPFLIPHKRTECHQAQTQYPGDWGLRILESPVNLSVNFSIWVTEKVVQYARVVVGNTEEDTGNSSCHIRILESFLDHHMILLDDGGAEKPLCISFQFLCIIRGDFVWFDHVFPQIHFPKPHAYVFHRKLVWWLVLDRSEKGANVTVDSMDTELIRSWTACAW
jgi:hypothetical protein